MLKKLSVEALKVNGGVILEARKQAQGLEQGKKTKCQELENLETGYRKRTFIGTMVTDGKSCAGDGECVSKHGIKACDQYWGLPLTPAHRY